MSSSGGGSGGLIAAAAGAAGLFAIYNGGKPLTNKEKTREAARDAKNKAKQTLQKNNKQCLSDALQKGEIPNCGQFKCGKSVRKAKMSLQSKTTYSPRATDPLNAVARNMLVCIDIDDDAYMNMVSSVILYQVLPDMFPPGQNPKDKPNDQTWTKGLGSQKFWSNPGSGVGNALSSLAGMATSRSTTKITPEQLQEEVKSIAKKQIARYLGHPEPEKGIFQMGDGGFVANAVSDKIGMPVGLFVWKNTWQVWNGATTVAPRLWQFPPENPTALQADLTRVTDQKYTPPGWLPIGHLNLQQGLAKLSSDMWSVTDGVFTKTRFVRGNALRLLEQELNSYVGKQQDAEARAAWQANSQYYQRVYNFGQNAVYFKLHLKRMSSVFGRTFNVTDGRSGCVLKSYAWQTIGVHMFWLSEWVRNYQWDTWKFFTSMPATPQYKYSNLDGEFDFQKFVPTLPRRQAFGGVSVNGKTLDFDDCAKPEAWDYFAQWKNLKMPTFKNLHKQLPPTFPNTGGDTPGEWGPMQPGGGIVHLGNGA